ncbi:hypothetical protein EV363DRAFT_1204102 [Boletus edulis]|nr:hypothetical protein EV363DRAFT_1204102 [Boletus edulis]
MRITLEQASPQMSLSTSGTSTAMLWFAVSGYHFSDSSLTMIDLPPLYYKVELVLPPQLRGGLVICPKGGIYCYLIMGYLIG